MAPDQCSRSYHDAKVDAYGLARDGSAASAAPIYYIWQS